ncbi:hypothetical protein PENTCL1PPCAC_30821, partial [Pristionchus entomophagus]
TPKHDMNAMFDPAQKQKRVSPKMPSHDRVDYIRAASWATISLSAILADKEGKQLFRCFLFKCFTEENINFIEATDKMRGTRQKDAKKMLSVEIY